MCLHLLLNKLSPGVAARNIMQLQLGEEKVFIPRPPPPPSHPHSPGGRRWFSGSESRMGTSIARLEEHCKMKQNWGKTKFQSRLDVEFCLKTALD